MEAEKGKNDARNEPLAPILDFLKGRLDEARSYAEDLDRLRENEIATPTELHDAYCDVEQALVELARFSISISENWLLDEWRLLGGLALRAEGREDYMPEGTRHRGALGGTDEEG